MNSETFSANIQCKLLALENDSPRDQCKRFIQKFSEFTNTKWIVKRSPAVQRLEFRKQYGCQHSSFNKKHEKRNRNFQCSATINIKYKKNRNTIKNDVLLKDGMNENENGLEKHFVKMEKNRWQIPSDSTERLLPTVVKTSYQRIIRKRRIQSENRFSKKQGLFPLTVMKFFKTSKRNY